MDRFGLDPPADRARRRRRKRRGRVEPSRAPEQPAAIPRHRLADQLGVGEIAIRGDTRAEDALGRERRVRLRAGPQQPVNIVAGELARVRREHVPQLGEPVGAERADQRGKGQIGPDAPHPPRRRAPGQRVADRPAHELVRVMPVVRRRRDHDRRVELIAELRERPGQDALGLHEIVAAGDREGWLEDAQLEARTGARLDDLGSTPFVIGGPPETAGDVDDPRSGIAERHQGGGCADGLIVGMR